LINLNKKDNMETIDNNLKSSYRNTLRTLGDHKLQGATGERHQGGQTDVQELAAGRIAATKVHAHNSSLKNINSFINVAEVATTHAQQMLDSLVTLRDMAIGATGVQSDNTRATQHQPQFEQLLNSLSKAVQNNYVFDGIGFFNGNFKESCISSIHGTNIHTEDLDFSNMDWTISGLGLFNPNQTLADYEAAQTELDTKTTAVATVQTTLDAKTTARDVAQAALDVAISAGGDFTPEQEALDTAVAEFATAQAALDIAKADLTTAENSVNAIGLNISTDANAHNAAEKLNTAIQTVTTGKTLINAQVEGLRNMYDIVNNNLLVQQNIRDENLLADPVMVNSAIETSKVRLRNIMCFIESNHSLQSQAVDFLNHKRC
jgi:hypothetical protein